MAITLLAVCITAITGPFVAGAQNDQEDARSALATALASEMMEEVLASDYDDPDGASELGPESGESSRAKFDNIDDYDGYAESEWLIANQFGEVATGAAAEGLSRSVDVDYVYVSGQGGADPATFVRITVVVSHHDRPLATLVRLRYAHS